MEENPLHRPHPNLSTVKKIRKLAEYREFYRKQKGNFPTRTSACRTIRVGHRTVMRHAPELFEKWYEDAFRF